MATKSAFKGRSINLLRASPTRMAGHFYAMHRRQPRELNVKKLKRKQKMKPGEELKEVLSDGEETQGSDDDSVSVGGTKLNSEVDV